jgi:hypothetical protein
MLASWMTEGCEAPGRSKEQDEQDRAQTNPLSSGHVSGTVTPPQSSCIVSMNRSGMRAARLPAPLAPEDR